VTALLLTTKLHPPPMQSALVPRPRLIQRLNAGVAGTLTLVSAPAGFGKTTLLSDWARHSETRVAWLSLDAGDSDLVRFLGYFVAALGQLHAGIGAGALAMLGSPQPSPLEAVLTALLNDVATLSTPCALVLDGYHAIEAQPVHGALAFLLDHLPRQMHLVIGGRADPPLPLARLRGRGQLAEIREDDLRFSLDEATAFLNQIMGLGLSGDEVAALEARTEGWIVGLQLAALSMKGRHDTRQFVASFTGSHHYVLDYLMEEVFRQQPAVVRDFLLRTAILDQFTAALCDAVREPAETSDQVSAAGPDTMQASRPSSQSILEYLEKAHLFVAPLDDQRQWYRCHGLFADLLRHQLQLSMREDQVLNLHRRASRWYETQDHPAEAVRHAIAAQDWENAARLIHATASNLLRRGEAATLLSWCAKLPVDVVRLRPELCLDHAWALLLAGCLDAAEPLLQSAAQSGMHDVGFLGQVVSAQSYLAWARGDHRRSVETGEKALSLLPESDVATRGLVAMNLGLAYWHAGFMAEAERALNEAHRAALGSNNQYARVTSRVFLGRVRAVRGELHQAAEALRAIIAEGGQYAILSVAHIDLGVLHYEWNELERAADHLLQGMELARRSGNAEFLVAAYFMQARLALARGERPAVAESARAIQELAQVSNLSKQTLSRIASCALEIALAQGDAAAAEAWARQAVVDSDAHPFYRYLSLSRLRLLIAQGQKQTALQELQACYERASQAGWGYGLIAVRVLQCLSAETRQAALEFLTDALQRARPEGFVRTFADAGVALEPLLQEVAQRGVAPEYAGRILAAIGRKPTPMTPEAPGLVEPLSERELEVLHLLAAGLSNREIAHKLVISLGTAKTHVHNVCSKLGARSRAHAVARAQELHLI